ncbi:MAG: 30S ribosomal protein S16 [Candidatus Kaelpia imicola]|nr:30S ribosomal protein S16 [Candidatus Kaelpia imicola]
MAVKIRLRRMGKKKAPHYRIVVVDSRAARDGRFIEQIGSYDPRKEATQAKIDREKAMEWIKKGAQLSETVKSLMKKNGMDPDEFKKAIKKKK